MYIFVSANGLASVKSTWQSFLELLGVIIIFVIVIVLCYFTTKFVAGKQLKQRKNGNMELIETMSVAQNKYLQLLKIGEKYIVISVTKDRIDFLTEVSKEELVFSETGAVNTNITFMDVMNKIRKGSNKEASSDSQKENENN